MSGLGGLRQSRPAEQRRLCVRARFAGAASLSHMLRERCPHVEQGGHLRVCTRVVRWRRWVARAHQSEQDERWRHGRLRETRNTLLCVGTAPKCGRCRCMRAHSVHTPESYMYQRLPRNAPTRPVEVLRRL